MNLKTLLEKLISISSVSGEEQKISDFLADYLNTRKFQVNKVMTNGDRPNLVATFGNSQQYLGFYGHMDTVAPDPNFQSNPFQIYFQQDRALGLGAADMKGGIAAILLTAEYAVQKKLPVKIIFGVDEENISEGSHNLVDSGFLQDVDFIIAAESGQVSDHQEDFSVCYGRKGRVLFQILVSGKTKHAAEDQKDINVIYQTAMIIQYLKDLDFPFHLNLGETKIVLHSVYAKTDSFSIPASCTLTFSLLTTPSVKSTDLSKKIMDFAQRNNIVAEIQEVERKTSYSESYEVDRSDPFLKNIELNIFSQLRVKPMYTTSVADENVFANRLHIPVISIGPIGGGDHTKDEWVSMSSLRKVTAAYQQILSRFHGQNVVL